MPKKPPSTYFAEQPAQQRPEISDRALAAIGDLIARAERYRAEELAKAGAADPASVALRVIEDHLALLRRMSCYLRSGEPEPGGGLVDGQ